MFKLEEDALIIRNESKLVYLLTFLFYFDLVYIELL